MGEESVESGGFVPEKVCGFELGVLGVVHPADDGDEENFSRPTALRIGGEGTPLRAIGAIQAPRGQIRASLPASRAPDPLVAQRRLGAPRPTSAQAARNSGGRAGNRASGRLWVAERRLECFGSSCFEKAGPPASPDAAGPRSARRARTCTNSPYVLFPYAFGDDRLV